MNKYIAKQLGNPTGFGGKLITHIMNRQNFPLYGQVVELLPLSSDDTVLDIGCGNGCVLNMLASRYDCEFTGIDISPSIIAAASKRNRAFVKTGKMKLVCQNVRDMSFSEGSFSKAYTINTVYFWDNPNKTMRDIYRVLKPGGLFVNALYTNETLSRFSHTRFGYTRYTEEHLTKAGAGFSTEVVPILSGAAYCVLYRKIGG